MSLPHANWLTQVWQGISRPRRRILCACLAVCGTSGVLQAAEHISLQEYLQQRYPGEADPVTALLRDTSNPEPLTATPALQNVGAANDYAVRWGLGHAVGRTVGVPGSYTTLEGFIPLVEESRQSLLFMELRGHLDN